MRKSPCSSAFKLLSDNRILQDHESIPSSGIAVVVETKPALPQALLFPGEGSKFVGMTRSAIQRPAVDTMFTAAQQVLGWDPRDAAFNGSLSRPKFCQPLTFLAGLAAFDVLGEQRPETVRRRQAVAGIGVGEYAALVAAEVVSFEDGLRLVQSRAAAMERASGLRQQATCAVVGLNRATLQRLCEEARLLDQTENPECAISALMYPRGFECGGTRAAVDRLCELARERGALQARVLPVGHACHTCLMEPARSQLCEALQDVSTRMSPPKCAVYLNSTGRRTLAGSDPTELLGPLAAQLTRELRWEGTIREMLSDGVQDFFEMGPLKQLKATIKKIDTRAFMRTEGVSV